MTALSIITVAYNSAATIGDTLDSVNAQTFADLEYVVVDGASRDDTLRIVEARGKRVSKLVSERDKGIYDAYNKALGLATGDVIGFINSDDFYCDPQALAAVMERFEDPAVESVHADLVYIDKDDTRRITRHWISGPVTPQRLASGFVPAHPGLFLRRSVYERCGVFDTSYRLSADFEFMFRVLHTFRTPSVYLPRIVVKMRTGGATGGSFASVRRQNDEILRAMAQHGVRPSRLKFFGLKAVDRFRQRLRARTVRLPGVAG